MSEGKPAPYRQIVLFLGAFALLKILIHVCTLYLGPYGYFRDEFYYFDCAANLSWGYVDNPPLAPFILAIVRATLGDSILAIRLPAILAGGGTVFMAGLIAAELGGGRFAQGLACLSVIAAPVFLGMSSFFSMNPIDYLLWTIAAYVLVRIINTDNARLWLWFGLVAGLGLQNKLSMAFFGGLVAAGLLLTPQRKYYRDKHLWVGGLIAFLIFLPNIFWQVKYGWPTLEFMHDTRLYKNIPEPLPKFLVNQFLFIGPLGAPVWIAGLLYAFFSKPGRKYRIFGYVYIGLIAAFYASNGKPYYVAPIYPAMLALGAVCLEQITVRRRWPRYALPALIVVTGVLLSPHAMPVLSPQGMIKLQDAMSFRAPQQERAHAGVLPQHIGDRLGWDEFIAMMNNAYHQLDPADRERCSILVSNYGEAGAINLFGPKLGLPHAVSGYMSYYLWGPGDMDGTCVLAYWPDRKTLDDVFEQVTEVAKFTHPYVMERQNNRPLYLCRNLKMPMEQAWPKFKRYW